MTSPEADELALAEAKRLLRRAVGLRRRVRPAEQRAADDTARTTLVRDALVARDRPAAVAAYVSGADEPGTLELLSWLASVRVRVLLPVLTGHLVDSGAEPSDGEPDGEPDWAPYEGSDRLRAGPLGIVEPDTAPLGRGALVEADVVLVPALGGSPTGDRLGRGGGWYDRALLHSRPGVPAWAMINDDEVFDVVPAHGWDVPVQALVTPTRMISCR